MSIDPESLPEDEARAAIEALHSPILDSWRAQAPTLPTSMLILYMTSPEAALLVELFRPERPTRHAGRRPGSPEDIAHCAALDAHNDLIRAAVLAACVEIDRRIPVPTDDDIRS